MRRFDLDESRILDLYKTKSCQEIADEFGVAWLTIAKRLREKGIRITRKPYRRLNKIFKEDAGLQAIHNWVRPRMPLPKICIDCGTDKNIDLANRGIYDRNFENWKWQCRQCHMTEDGRMKQLKQFR